ncbi:DMT family transporter [Marinomonas agarivorans]|nr:DMT family transporter [Marinomonas agarivorans]
MLSLDSLFNGLKLIMNKKKSDVIYRKGFYRKSYIYIFAAILASNIIPLSDALAKISSSNHSIIQIVWARFFFFTIISSIFLLYTNSYVLLKPSGEKFLIFRGGALLISIFLFYSSLQFLPLASALSIWFIQPFILILLTNFFLGERVKLMVWVAILVGFFGVLVANKPEFTGFHWATFLAAGSGVAYAYFLFITRLASDGRTAVEVTYQTGIIGSIVCSILVVPFWSWPSLDTWILFLLIGCISALSHYLTVFAYSNESASKLAPLSYTELIGAAILGFIIFSDIPDLWSITGFLLIIISGVYLTLISPPE